MRHVAQIKAGFYPVPPQAVEALAARLRPPSGPFALLDPCAGEGAAVKQLAGLLGVRPDLVHAIELDEGRADCLRAALPDGKVLAPAGFLGCAASPWSFPLAWVNPPFDDQYGGGRVEGQFLRRVTDWLVPGGVVALCCPERVASGWDVRQVLMQWYDRVTVLPFGEEWRRFDEVIVLAVRRKAPVPYYEVNWGDLLAPEGHVYRVPAGEGPRRFEKVEMTEAELARALDASPLRRHLTGPPETPLPSPPLALGTGHIALLLASGHLDGVVAPPGEAPHVVRGTARKVEYVSAVETTEDAQGRETTKTTISEKIQLVVRAVDPSGEIRTFEEG